jgi:ADP-heptose:LPS heptosyltransferase
LSASISCSEALAAIRRGEKLPSEVVRRLGEEQPGEFFRIIIEGLADSFEPADAASYEELMRVWIPADARVAAVAPARVDCVYVLSRVTLGADIKIASIVLDAMKRRFPEARIAFVANRKSAELFMADERVEWVESNYPRSGAVSSRIAFAELLRAQVAGEHRIVIDPDSRMTQLGLIPVCEPERYFHFPSRSEEAAGNLSELTARWLTHTFGVAGQAYVAPSRVVVEGAAPRAAVSFGVGENDSKRIGGDFEAQVLRVLGARFRTIWIDRGVGGEEARRVTEAVAASGLGERARFWEGSFAGFASVISQCDFYVGYDSAGQHAAAAAGVPLVTFFKGASSARFRERWMPAGECRITLIDADAGMPEACLDRLRALVKS